MQKFRKVPRSGYTVETRKADGTSVATNTVAASPRSFTKTGLVNKTAYFFRVIATNANGNSGPVNSNNVTPVPPPPPPPEEPTVPQLLRPSAAYAFAPGESQRFAVMSTDVQGDRYQPQVELVADNGAAVSSKVHMPPADSGSASEAVIDFPLLEGRYRWRARSCDITPAVHCSEYSPWQSFSVAPLLKASAGSSTIGLEDFYGYHDWPTGAGTAYVNTANGNLVLQETDLEVPGPLNLRITRTYNTLLDAQDGPLGRGWTLGFVEGEGMVDSLLDAVLSLDADRMIRVIANEDVFTLYDADGTTHRFAKGGTAGLGWHSPPGVNLTLTDGADGLTRWYHLTRPDGVRYEFKVINGAYRLARIADRPGNALVFTYTGTKLGQISDGNGRVLTFTWDENRLAQARYSADSQHFDIAYAYDDATGRLASVTQAAGTPDARSRTFAYNGAGLSAVTDARGNTTSFAVAGGKLTGVTDREGHVWAVRYDGDCNPAPAARFTATCVIPPGGNAAAAKTWTVNEAGNPVAIVDEGDADETGNPRRHGRRYTWTDNRLTREVDESGHATDYAYNRLGQITQQTFAPVGETPVVSEFRYEEFEGAGDMNRARIAVGLPEERVYQFAYDGGHKGLLVRQTDPRGKSTTFEYYANGLLKSVTDPLARKTTYGDPALPGNGYHFAGQPLKITDATNATITLAYDFLGWPISRVDRNGKTWTQTWDLRGNRRSSSDPLGQTTRYCYDLNNNQVLELPPKQAGGDCTAQPSTHPHAVRFTHDKLDRLTLTEINNDGQRRNTAKVYDAAGRLTETLLPLSWDQSTGTLLPVAQRQAVRYELHPNGRVKAHIDPEGNRTDLVYTPAGLVRRVTEPPDGSGPTATRRATTYTYNARGQEILSKATGQQGTTRHEYNVLGELVAFTTPKGQTTRYAYDANGRLVATTDARGRISDRTYNDAGELTSLKQPADLGGVIHTRYTYGPLGLIASETDPADPNHLITYDYDAEGRQTRRNDVNNGIVTRTIETTRRADGLPAQQVSSIPSSAVGMHKTVFTYDANGNQSGIQTHLDGSATPNVSEITIDFTSADEVATWTETLHPPTGSPVTKASTYTYAPDGNLKSRSIDGTTTTYQRLRNGLESSTTAWGTAGTATSSWTPSGLPQTQTLPNGAVAAYTYDLAGRANSKLVTKAGATLSAWQQVTYDEDNNRTGELVSQVQPGGGTKTGNATYSYDVVDRLVQAKHPFEAQAKNYVLDEGGNIIADGESAYTYTKNRLAKRQLTEAPADWPAELGPFPASEFRTTFAYDQHGNMSQQAHYVPEEPAATATFTYDAASHPRRTTSPDGSWVEYAYDGLGRMVRRHDSTGQTQLLFHDQDSGQISLQTDGTGTSKTRYVLDSWSAPIGQEQVGGAGFGWYVTDLRGNLTQLLDTGGTVKAVFAYDPFGKEKTAHTSSTSGFDSALRFQLAPVDQATGSYNLGPRLYDPGINRFVGADFYVSAQANMELATDPLTGNRYLYAGANPAGLIDDGHFPFTPEHMQAKPKAKSAPVGRDSWNTPTYRKQPPASKPKAKPAPPLKPAAPQPAPPKAAPPKPPSAPANPSPKPTPAKPTTKVAEKRQGSASPSALACAGLVGAAIAGGATYAYADSLRSGAAAAAAAAGGAAATGVGLPVAVIIWGGAIGTLGVAYAVKRHACGSGYRAFS